MNPRGRRLARALAAATAVAAIAGGCAIQADSGPRDVPADHPARRAIEPLVEGDEATGEGRIYLVAPNEDGRLRTVLRNTTTPQNLIETLLLGPNGDEVANGLSTDLPSLVDVHSVRFDGGVVDIDVSSEIEDIPENRLRTAVAQIVYTASQLPGAESVSIRVDGNVRSWPDGDGNLRHDPLTVFDFIGYAESSQPAYPVTPLVPVTSTTVPPTTAPSTTVPPTTAPSTTAPSTTLPVTIAAG